MMTTNNTGNLRRKEVMAINPRKIKKRPAKDLKPGDLRSQVLEKGKPTPAKDLRSTDPKSLRNKSLREANRTASERKVRPAKDIKAGDARTRFLENAKKGKTPGTSLTTTNKPPVKTGSNTGGAKPKGTPKLKGSSPKLLSGPSTASKAVGIGGTIAKQFWSKVGGPATMLVAMTEPAGVGSDNPSGPLMKGNNMQPTFAKGKGTAALPKKKETIMPKASMAGGGVNKPKASVIMPKASMAGGGVNKPGGARAHENVTDRKSSTTSTAATSAAASNRKRPQTRYQRNELAMEQRKRSSSGQRKSILSLFRKG